MRTNRVILCFSITITCFALQNCDFEKENELHEAAVKRFGPEYNRKRKALSLAPVPDSGWENSRTWVYSDGKIGLLTFRKLDSDNDSLPRRAIKDVHFYSATLQPVREIDTYYSGKRYLTESRDSEEWERLLITYNYVNDSLGGYRDSPVLSSKAGLVAGRYEAFLCSPRPLLGSSNTDPVKRISMLLKSQPISMAQADSVLNRWGIDRLKE